MATPLFKITDLAGNLYALVPANALQTILNIKDPAVDRIMRSVAQGQPCELHGNGKSLFRQGYVDVLVVTAVYGLDTSKL
jgi:hypothetical protein